MVRLPKRVGNSKMCRTLELCAGGCRTLPYLGRKFGFRIFGSDSSQRGCQLLKADLSLLGVEGGVV